MKKYIWMYFVLLLFLVMGAFASMALNAYGVTLMSYSSLGFSLLFGYELLRLSGRRFIPRDKRAFGLELLILFSISLGYFLKGITIEIPFASLIGDVMAVMLLGLNAYYFYSCWQSVKNFSLKLNIGIVLYFIALYCVLAAGYFFQFQNSLGLLFTAGGILCLIAFIVIGWLKGIVIVNGEETSAIRVVGQFRNKSSLQLIGLMLMMTYYSFNQLNVLPQLYIGSLPNGYLKVVRQREAGKNEAQPKTVDPRDYEDAYKRFIDGK